MFRYHLTIPFTWRQVSRPLLSNRSLPWRQRPCHMPAGDGWRYTTEKKMIVISASNNELELSGSTAELLEIATGLSGLKHGQVFRFEADSEADPSPYAHTLSALEAYISEGPMRVSVDDGILYLTGSAEMVVKFSSWFEFDEDAQRGDHNHHEWFEGNEFISPESRSLVISVV